MSLIHWWPLNGDTNDYGSNPKPGTLYSGTDVTTAGIIGKCLSGMDGTQTPRGMSVANCNLLDELAEGKYAFACWFKVHGTHIHYMGTLMSSGDWNNNRWAVGVSQNNTQIDVFSDGSHNTYINLGYTLTTNKWYHLVSVQNGTTNTLYINGELVGSRSATAINKSSATNLCIGRETYANGYFSFNGDICDARVYDHALSKKEVREIYTHPIISYDFDRVLGNNILAGKKLTMGSLGASVSNSTAPTFGSMKFTTATAGSTRLQIPLDLLTANLVYRTSFIVQCPAGLTFNINDWCDSGTITNKTTTTLGPDKYLIEADVTRASYDSTYRFFDFNASGAGTYEISGFQMCPLNIILDNSGFNNHGTMSAMSLSSTTDRGRYSGYFNGTTAYCEFNNLKSDMVSSDFSIAFGVYPSSNGKRSVFLGDHQLTNGVSFNIERNNSNYLRVYVGGSPDLAISACTITTGVWTHIAITYNKAATTLKVYKNGSCVYTKTDLNITLTKTVGSKFRLGKDSRSGSSASTTSETPYYGYMDYFHFYPVTLSDNDAKNLYKTRVQIARNSSLFVDRIAEETTARDIVFDYKMNLNSQSPMEFDMKNKFDGNVYFEPDGSAWLRIIHHNNPAGDVFTSSSDFTNSCYIDENRWFNAEVCDYLNSWELMIKQKVTSSSAEAKYRWIQTKNPMTAAYGDVDAADVTKITTTGYTSTTYGGIYKNTGGKTFLSANDGKSSNWYGAFGSYTAYNGGTPGWNATVVTSGYMDLYVRIDNTTISNLRRDASGDSESGGVFKSFNKGTVYADNIIER